MNVRIRSRVSDVALRVLFLAAFTSSLGLADFAHTQSQDESAPLENLKESVSRLLSEPVYTSADEVLLNRAGDAAALVVTGMLSKQEMDSPENGRRILLILHLAFEAPQSIIDPKNNTPTATLRLLDRLEQTDYGRQPNVIGNARFEIEHNASTGQPLQLVTPPGEPAIDWGHSQWVNSVLAWISTIKPGMTRSDLLRVFTTEGGLATRTHRIYVLKQCRIIKIDVEFSVSAREAEDRVAHISRPYLDYATPD
jgi:hypothetical protein